MQPPNSQDLQAFNETMAAMLPRLRFSQEGSPEFPEEEAVGGMLLEMSNRLGAMVEAHKVEAL